MTIRAGVRWAPICIWLIAQLYCTEAVTTTRSQLCGSASRYLHMTAMWCMTKQLYMSALWS